MDHKHSLYFNTLNRLFVVFLSFFRTKQYSYVSCVPDVELKGQDQFLSTLPPDLLSAGDETPHISPTISANRSQLDSATAPQPAKIPPPQTRKTFRHKNGL